MRRLLLVWIFLAATGTAMAQELTETRQAAARAAIDSVLNERFLAGWNRHDAHLFASAFALDADFTNILGMGASGRGNIEKFHAQAFERFFMHSEQTAQIQKVRFLSADVAVVDVRWQMTGAVDAHGKPVAARAGLMDLVFTAPGGEWLITVMHNTELTDTAAHALAPDKKR
jgi:uncharacterized protein (TIGR02246 family)